MATADDIVDALFNGIDEDKYHIIVGHPSDVPTTQQIKMRMNDVVNGNRPTTPEQLGMILKISNPGGFAARLDKMGATVGAKSKL